MLRFAALLALLAAAGCCSAFNLQVSDALTAYVAAQGEAAVGRELYFPCADGVTAKEMQGLDLNRYQGPWYQTNVAMSTSHYIDTNKVQKSISESMSCLVSSFNDTNPNAKKWSQVLNLRQAVNVSVPIPGWQVVGNGNALYRNLNVSTPHPGNNGKWLLRVDIGNSSAVWVDVLIVATDYTNVATWYTCQDIPVPGTADTAREQQWGLQRRVPRNFNALELAALKLIAMSRGIHDADRLYTFPTDGCW